MYNNSVCVEDQAEILNKQFQSVFTKEDLKIYVYNVPECCGLPIPLMHNVTISVGGVKKVAIYPGLI